MSADLVEVRRRGAAESEAVEGGATPRDADGGRYAGPEPTWWRRVLELERWRLSSRVAVVVALPLVVAVALGSIRLVGEVRDAVELTDAGRHVDGLRAVVATELAVAIVSGRKAAGTVVPEDLAPLDRALAELERVRRISGLPDQAADAMRDMSEGAGRVRAATAVTVVPIEDLIRVQHTMAADSDTVVEAVLAPIKSVDIINDKNRLLDVWAAQRQLVTLSVAVVKLMRNPAEAGAELTGAIGASGALLDRLNRYYPADDPRLRQLQATQAAHAQLAQALRAALPRGVRAVREVGYGDALVRDGLVLGKMVEEAAGQISDTAAARVDSARSAAIWDSVLLLGTLVIGLVVAVRVARSLLRPLRRLHDSARQVAEVDLPAEVVRINTGDSVGIVTFAPVPVDSTEEIGRVARAVDDIHEQALRMAGEQRRLRLMVDDLFDALARRMKNLLDRQLQVLTTLEEQEDDPHRLDGLYQLDHLATRLRRSSDNLLVLAGTDAPAPRSDAVAIHDLLHAAASEVEQYQRIRIGPTPEVAVSGVAAMDVVHLLAELADNALRASRPDTMVELLCWRSASGGLVVDVADHGRGIGAADLATLNARVPSWNRKPPAAWAFSSSAGWPSGTASPSACARQSTVPTTRASPPRWKSPPPSFARCSKGLTWGRWVRRGRRRG
ncbi:MAG: HAMP domain-containing protein [Mycobacteriaceae bacterium]|nr:HAMP domain-containing protein [Mycobacteriaceae bacterium]